MLKAFDVEKYRVGEIIECLRCDNKKMYNATWFGYSLCRACVDNLSSKKGDTFISMHKKLDIKRKKYLEQVNKGNVSHEEFCKKMIEDAEKSLASINKYLKKTDKDSIEEQYAKISKNLLLSSIKRLKNTQEMKDG